METGTSVIVTDTSAPVRGTYGPWDFTSFSQAPNGAPTPTPPPDGPGGAWTVLLPGNNEPIFLKRSAAGSFGSGHDRGRPARSPRDGRGPLSVSRRACKPDRRTPLRRLRQLRRHARRRCQPISVGMADGSNSRAWDSRIKGRASASFRNSSVQRARIRERRNIPPNSSAAFSAFVFLWMR
jgi:hypothetical protein